MRCRHRCAPPAGSTEAAHAGVDVHAAQCLRCQLERAREQRMQRLLSGLREQQSMPRGRLLDEILAGLDDPTRPSADTGVTRTVVCAAAATAGTVGALVLANRARGRRLAG